MYLISIMKQSTVVYFYMNKTETLNELWQALKNEEILKKYEQILNMCSDILDQMVFS